MDDIALTVAEAARYCGLSVEQVMTYRHTKGFPIPLIKLKERPRERFYSLREVHKWRENRDRKSKAGAVSPHSGMAEDAKGAKAA